MKKVALIEFYTWHNECLYSQLLFLKESNYSPILICDVRQQKNIEYLNNIADEIIFFDFKKISSLFKLRKLLIKSGINDVFFNTAQGSITYKFLLLPFPKRIKFVGTIHNIKKLYSSIGQRIVCRKVKAFYILAEYLEKYFPTDKGLKCQSVSYSFFPPFNRIDLAKKNDQIWLTIPGAIEFKRRDYGFLLEVAKTKSLPQNVRFILLGNSKKGDGKIFIEQIQALKLEEKFIWFDNFVSNDLFQSYLCESDYLLPLIHPNTNAAEDYTKYKISGIFTLSQTHNKHMLCHALFAKVENFNYPNLQYSKIDDFIDILSRFPKESRQQNNNRIDFETNRRNYISLLELK